eukprot:353272-Chlamydomonas_euryale.AAC.11
MAAAAAAAAPAPSAAAPVAALFVSATSPRGEPRSTRCCGAAWSHDPRSTDRSRDLAGAVSFMPPGRCAAQAAPTRLKSRGGVPVGNDLSRALGLATRACPALGQRSNWSRMSAGCGEILSHRCLFHCSHRARAGVGDWRDRASARKASGATAGACWARSLAKVRHGRGQSRWRMSEPRLPGGAVGAPRCCGLQHGLCTFGVHVCKLRSICVYVKSSAHNFLTHLEPQDRACTISTSHVACGNVHEPQTITNLKPLVYSCPASSTSLHNSRNISWSRIQIALQMSIEI